MFDGIALPSWDGMEDRGGNRNECKQIIHNVFSRLKVEDSMHSP